VGYQDSQVDRALKDLKGFVRVTLAAGETQTVTFTLRADQLAYYAETQHGWVVEPIGYTVFVGPSSRTSDLLTAHFRIA
jgi:beta-glucosidase